jgi:hypothetical protein
LQIVSEWIRVADAKAGATLAVGGAVLALAAARLRGLPTSSGAALAALFVAILLAAASVLLAIWTVMPRARRLRVSSISHYGTIAAFSSAADYRVAALATFTVPDKLADALAGHIWTLSRIAMTKYRLVSAAIALLAGAMLVGTLGLLLN